jgi:hypothetical protein
VRSGWGAVVDGPSRAVGDRAAWMRFHTNDVHIESRHGCVCWGRVQCPCQVQQAKQASTLPPAAPGAAPGSPPVGELRYAGSPQVPRWTAATFSTNSTVNRSTAYNLPVAQHTEAVKIYHATPAMGVYSHAPMIAFVQGVFLASWKNGAASVASF